MCPNKFALRSLKRGGVIAPFFIFYRWIFCLAGLCLERVRALAVCRTISRLSELLCSGAGVAGARKFIFRNFESGLHRRNTGVRLEALAGQSLVFIFHLVQILMYIMHLKT